MGGLLTRSDRVSIDAMDGLVQETQDSAPLLVVAGQVILLLVKDIVDEAVGVAKLFRSLDAVACTSAVSRGRDLLDLAQHVGRRGKDRSCWCWNHLVCVCV